MTEATEADTSHATIHALLDDWGAPKTIHNPYTGTDDPMTVAGRLAEWRQQIVTIIEAASYHRNYRQACVDIAARLSDPSR